jgi:outer membrane receptor for ferrienterochelin and colicin
VNNFHTRNKTRLRRTALVAALTLGLAGVAHGQSTSGSFFGTVQPGETVAATSTSGLTRTVNTDAAGRFALSALPVGTYEVTLQRDGKVISRQSDVTIKVGSGTELSFATADSANPENAKSLAGITVSASALPPIDVTSVSSNTVITAKQLSTLPIGRSAEAIALLSPGAVQGSTAFAALRGPTGNALVAFGGSSVTENAYYLNGMNVTDPISGLGGIQLPYGSIEQQEILTGGYGAQYGRSDGGVISQVGKRGTNDWHFGAQLLFTPKNLSGNPRNIDYPFPTDKYPDSNVDPGQAGTLYRNRGRDNGWDAVESVYVGGPLIKDKLFLFASAEGERQTVQTTSAIGAGATQDRGTYHDPKAYVKLDWNINDSNILELTGASNKQSFNGNTYAYDYDTLSSGDLVNQDVPTKTSQKMYIAKYTGYITDALTVSAQYGKQSTEYYSGNPEGFDPNLIAILGRANQDPRITGGVPITNQQTILSLDNPDHKAKGANYRFDLSYVLGAHTLSAGIDNQRTQDINDSNGIAAAAGYAWQYGYQKGGANTPINFQVGSTGAPYNGYYVDQYNVSSGGTVEVDQRAQYVQDQWQVNDRWLLSLGLRNDQFNNYNTSNQAYIHQHSPQWQPRLGVAWDVNGDSSLKVYANAGRYYLALPTSLALRGASASTYLQTFYTYTGIDSVTGYPTGLTPIQTALGAGVPVSPDGEYGFAPDPALTTSKTLKAQYQDEYILGFDKTLSFLDTQWTYGAKATYRDLKNETDDTCDSDTLLNKAAALGIDVDANDPLAYRGCRFFNPGRAAVFVVKGTDGLNHDVPLTNAELGFPKAKRSYASLDLYLSHQFDGKWWGRIDYLLSHSYGNSEGQVRSDIGQADVAATEDWDGPSLETYAGGSLANDRRHQFKAFGGYQITPEWNVSGNVAIISGLPRSCIGLFGPDQTAPLYAGNNYHFCGGVPSSPGDAGRTPWEHIFSVNLEYRPAFADHKLAFSAYVYNILNEQKTTQYQAAYDSTYGLPISVEQPRYVRFGATYDF